MPKDPYFLLPFYFIYKVGVGAPKKPNDPTPKTLIDFKYDILRILLSNPNNIGFMVNSCCPYRFVNNKVQRTYSHFSQTC